MRTERLPGLLSRVEGGEVTSQLVSQVPNKQRLEKSYSFLIREFIRVSPPLATFYPFLLQSLFFVFRGMAAAASSQAVFFAQFRVTTQCFYATKLCAALVNLKPILPGHCLVIPRRVVRRFTELSSEEVH